MASLSVSAVRSLFASVAVTVGCAACAQTTQPPSGAVFEVASVRKSTEGMTRMSAPGSAHLSYEHITLKLLIAIAYRMDSDRIVSPLGWLDSDSFDIRAEAPNDTPLEGEALGHAMQTLLRERFHLTTRTTDKVVSGYRLIAAPNGPKLAASKKTTQNLFLFTGRIHADGVQMKTFAGMLASPLERPVEDATGLTGRYDFDLSFAPLNSTDSSLPSLEEAVKESLGLELKPAKVPIDVLVVDHADRTPTPD